MTKRSQNRTRRPYHELHDCVCLVYHAHNTSSLVDFVLFSLFSSLTLHSYKVACPCAPCRPEIKFKGESTTHADYPPHPNDVFKNALAEQARTVNQAPGIPSVVLGGSRFEGESSAQRDYQAPPLEALRQMLENRDVKPSPGQTPIRFEGQSSMHADYQAPPPATPFTPARLEGRRPESVIGGSYDMCATSIKESTSHHDYQAPPLEDLMVRAETAAQRRSDVRTPPTRFEGQSTAHLDYIAPPANSFLAIARGPERPEETQELLRPDAPTLKQSTTHHDYQPPPLDQINQVTCKEKSRESFERVCFEGESTTHADYPAHPIAEQTRTVSQAPGIPSVVLGGSRFEGESSAQRDYQAPPLEALRQMLENRDVKPSPGQTPIRFEGQSSMHADYQAPPPATPFTPARLEGRRPESVIGGSYDMCATSIKESTSHHDYQAPPLEDLMVRAETAAQRRSDVRTPPTRFEGQSTAHLDYIAPPANSFLAIARGPERPEETQELLGPDAPTLKQSTTHHDYQPPPLDQIKQVTCKEKSRESFERVCFEGESTTHADYPAHPIAEQARTVSQAPGIPSVVLGGSRFEGESSAQRDYQAPPLEALRQMLENRDVKPSPGQTPIRFEGQSSMHADYQAPPRPLDGLRQWLRGSGYRGEKPPGLLILAGCSYSFFVCGNIVFPGLYPLRHSSRSLWNHDIPLHSPSHKKYIGPRFMCVGWCWLRV